MKINLSILFLFLWLNIFGQQYNFKRYSVSEGLAQSQVYALLEDKDGYIWMGTQGGGLSRFDGLSFDNFTTQDGLANNYIEALHMDDNGVIYIGTQNGLSIFHGQSFINYNLHQSLKIESIISGAENKLWLGTNKGLYFFENDSLLKFQNDSKLLNQKIYDIEIDKNKNLWLATDIGLVKMANGTPELIKNENGFKSNFINDIFIQNDKIWIATYGAGIFLYENETFTSIKGQNDPIVFDILNVENNLWMGSLRQGISVLNTQTFSSSNFNEDSGLPGNQVRALLHDSWGNIWVGLSGSGVACYTGQQFEYYSRDNGLPGRQIYAIEQGVGIELFLGISDQGLYRFDPLSNEKFEHINGIENVKVKAIFKDSENRIWIGTDNKGCYYLKNDSLHHINGLSVNWIKAFEEDLNGNIYIGTAGGGINVLTFSDSTNYSIDILTKHDGLNENRITDLVVDSLNRIWFSTPSQGIGVIFPSRTILSFSTDEGLQSNDIRSLTIDKRQNLWIASPSSGITNMDLSDEKLSFSPFEYQHNHVIYFMQFDQDNNLWLGTEAGLDKVVLNNQQQALETFHYSKPDGFLGVETCTNSSLLDQKGQLWFGTIDGFCKTNPDEKVKNSVAPKLKIEQVNLFYKPIQETHLKAFLNDKGEVNDTLILTYDQNHLTFNFKGIDLINPEKVMYQWMLIGQEEKWSPFSNVNQVSYSNLNPGSYQFAVRCCNKDGVCNEKSKTIDFVILTPYWQKLWFKVGGIIGLSLLLMTILFIIVRNIRKKSKEKNNRLKLEKNVLELEQKALRLQMNPHFIFNSLNSIQGLIAANDNKNARLSLSRFSKLMRQTLENSRESFISIESEIAILKNYLDLEKHTHQDKFDYKINTESEALEEKIPPLLIQPFVENAIIHGVLPKNGKGTILLDFLIQNDHLVIKIEDNGIGRSKSTEKNLSITEYHKSTGLAVTRERIENLGQDDGIEFKDLYDEEGRATGTLVIIRLPLLKQ